jgi:hypothetical protein
MHHRRKHWTVSYRFQSSRIVFAYALGYALAGFTTFITILGRYDNVHQNENRITACEVNSCCSLLEQDSTQGFVSNVKATFVNFALGFRRLFKIRNQRGLKTILKSSLFILITAENACILTAETVMTAPLSLRRSVMHEPWSELLINSFVGLQR